MEIHPKVTQISIWWDRLQVEVEAYFIKGQRNAIIDTGPPQAPDPIGSALRALDLRLADIDLILNTHAHVDHTGEDAVIKAAAPAQLLLHKDDVLLLEDPQHCFNQYYAPVVEALRGREYLDQERMAFLESLGAGVTVDRQLEDNHVIDVGDDIELRVIHLPGHTQGSVGFYWEKEGILFSGDSVSGLHVEGGKLPVITDFSAYEKSIKRLLGIPIQLLLCGHRYRGLALAPCSVRRGEEIKQYLRDSQETAKRIVEAVRRVASSSWAKPLVEITDGVVAELPEEMGFKRMAELPSPLFSAGTVFWCLRQLDSL
jgi:glyoxylase-like metal-dependent hydrolase (beta-lactamase superfamily II)